MDLMLATTGEISPATSPSGKGGRRITTVVIIRHGHVEGIDPPLFRGQTQLAFTRQGLQEATLVAEHIASTRRSAAVHVSPLERCKVTGAKIVQACGLFWS
jgi:broad specificity phosphatase PhoE